MSKADTADLPKEITVEDVLTRSLGWSVVTHASLRFIPSLVLHLLGLLVTMVTPYKSLLSKLSN